MFRKIKFQRSILKFSNRRALFFGGGGANYLYQSEHFALQKNRHRYDDNSKQSASWCKMTSCKNFKRFSDSLRSKWTIFAWWWWRWCQNLQLCHKRLNRTEEEIKMSFCRYYICIELNSISEELWNFQLVIYISIEFSC